MPYAPKQDKVVPYAPYLKPKLPYGPTLVKLMQFMPKSRRVSIPVLSIPDRTHVQEILDRGTVTLEFIALKDGADVSFEVDHQVDLAAAQMKLTKPIDFERVLHDQPPVAVFEKNVTAMKILQDVAEILQIYSSATVTIEGHTATPSHKMDSWAQQLADNRAARVQEALEYLKIDPGRMSSRGFPGDLGDGCPNVIVQITGF